MPRAHSAAFVIVRDRLMTELTQKDRARLAALLGNMAEANRPLGPDLRRVLRAVASLDDDDLERLAKWFSTHMNRWGDTPREPGAKIVAAPRMDPPTV